MKANLSTIMVVALIATIGSTGFVIAQQLPSVSQQLPNVFKDAKPRVLPSPDVRPGTFDGNDMPVSRPKLDMAILKSKTLYTERLELLERKLELLESRISELEKRRK